MIVYQASKSEFVQDTDDLGIEYRIAQAYLQRSGRYAPDAEMRAWRHSLRHMADVLRDEGIPVDAGVAVEFGIPQTSKRIDFLLSGRDADDSPRVVIIELKQWSKSRLSDKDGIVVANRGGGSEREGTHPSYQAWSYAALLEGFNEAVYQDDVQLSPCAYLHNHGPGGAVDDERYAPYTLKAPLFLKGRSELERLQAFIRQHIFKGDIDLLYRIENGRIRPSKMLADSLSSMLKGNREFVLIDDQKLVYETALVKARKASPEAKQVVIVEGGPGTGKSVVAINLLVALTGDGLLGKYVSKNAAPRTVYQQRLKGGFRRSVIDNLFAGSGGFIDTPPDTYDVLIVDEAHRLNEKSGLYGNLGENQVKELINAAKCAVLFVDDDQTVTLSDIGETAELERWATTMGAEVTRMQLASQFRCNGSDGYLTWLDDVLGIRSTAAMPPRQEDFDFRVFDSPTAMHAAVEELNRKNNKSRVVAGYCWDWVSKRNPDAYDIVIPEYGYAKQWNLGSDGSLWIVAPDSIEQVGCIHTCQGLELEYVGVIIGADLVAGEGGPVPDATQRSKMDRSIRGWKKLMKQDPVVTGERVNRVIRNTYRTLMSRGMKGCFVYCVDSAMADYLRRRLVQPGEQSGSAPTAGDP
ncbi:DUF2075 domain-containing protein [Luteimonas sp. MJ174]|uniref:DUF2075 domain-containing protein n=1 Tax=Luteimonas sp. MJ174 TaxID=3129237 RepID=UPI0031BB06A8